MIPTVLLLSVSKHRYSFELSNFVSPRGFILSKGPRSVENSLLKFSYGEYLQWATANAHYSSIDNDSNH